MLRVGREADSSSLGVSFLMRRSAAVAAGLLALIYFDQKPVLAGTEALTVHSVTPSVELPDFPSNLENIRARNPLLVPITYQGHLIPWQRPKWSLCDVAKLLEGKREQRRMSLRPLHLAR